jgi:spore maturation protein CgeB
MSAAAQVRRLLIVGNAGGTNVGASLDRAARELGIETLLVDARRAFHAPAWLRHVSWRLLGHRPPRLASFCRAVVEEAGRFRPDCTLTTGLAPLTESALATLRAQGIRCVHYSTDDPWNRSQEAAWFLRSLARYDAVFSTRTANLGDFHAVGCAVVRHLPFGYDPTLSFPETLSPDQRRKLHAEVTFVGGADRDRVRLVEPLCGSGIRLALYGDYWDRFASTRAFHRGHAPPEQVRRATAAADINLCLVRRANRDGHVMRSFEAAACGACLLVEDTGEHRDLFGEDLACVAYFRSADTLLQRVRELLRDAPLRRRLGEAVRARITRGAHTYRDRLTSLLAAAPERRA